MTAVAVAHSRQSRPVVIHRYNRRASGGTMPSTNHRAVQGAVEVCQFQRLDRVVDVPVAVRQERSAQVQFVDKNTVVVTVVMQRQLLVVQKVQEIWANAPALYSELYVQRAGVTRQRLSHHCETPSLQSPPNAAEAATEAGWRFTPQNANWRPGQLPLGTGEIFFPVGRSMGPTAFSSWHFNSFSETPALMPCPAHGTAGAPSEPLARQSSSSQVTKKVAIVSVVTEIDLSGENPKLWYTTHAVSPEVRKTVKLSQGRHIDGIIGVPVSAPLRELTAALGIPQSQCRAVVTAMWQSQKANGADR